MLLLLLLLLVLQQGRHRPCLPVSLLSMRAIN